MAQDLIRRVLMKLDKNYLPYEHFENLEEFLPTKILEGAYVTRLPSDKGIYLHAEFNKGTKIIEHYHNARQYMYIKKGKVLVQGNTELKEGDEVAFEPFEVHSVIALEKCEMYIQFTKDESFKKYK